VRLNGQATEGLRLNSEPEIRSFASSRIYVYGTAVDSIGENAPAEWLVAGHEAPNSQGSFARLVKADYYTDGDGAIVEVDGVETSVGMSPRFALDLMKTITRALAGPKGPVIELPSLDGDVTTLAAELAFFDSQLKWRLDGYTVPAGSVPDAVLSILVSHTKEGLPPLSGTERTRLTNIIGQFVKLRKPVPVTISYAIGVRIPNRLKFFEDAQVPTLAWVHTGWFFKLLNEKVKRVYAPGLRIVVFDEATLFASMLPGFSLEGVEKFLDMTRELFRRMDTPIEIIPLSRDQFPEKEVGKVSVLPDRERTYAILCSLPEMQDPDIMHDLYHKRDRDYDAARRLAGPLWAVAEQNSAIISRYLTYRKNARLFSTLLGGSDFVDACVTEKEERIVLDMTANALPNHGMPLVRRNVAGAYSMKIVPEYRFTGRRNMHPVRIALSEFGIDSPGEMTFYYREESVE
jgi:hypothetical protein